MNNAPQKPTITREDMVRVSKKLSVRMNVAPPMRGPGNYYRSGIGSIWQEQYNQILRAPVDVWMQFEGFSSKEMAEKFRQSLSSGKDNIMRKLLDAEGQTLETSVYGDAAGWYTYVRKIRKTP